MVKQDGGAKPPKPERKGDGDRLEAADYVSSAVAELALVARRHRLDTLGYLLDMAKLEADEVARLHRDQAT